MGKSIGAWDSFYKKHYQWLLTMVRSMDDTHAQSISSRLMVKLFLRDPQIIIDSSKSRDRLKEEIADKYPAFLDIIRHGGSNSVDSYELMLNYYLPN